MNDAGGSRVAACGCGALTVECAGAPRLVSRCHCTACQRRTGAPFGIAAFYDEDTVRIYGASRRYRRGSDAGFDVVFHFCPDCGATVYWYPLRKPGQIAIATGAFADPDYPAPTQDAHEETRHGWVPPLTQR